MQYRPNLVALGVNIPLAIAFALAAPHGGFGLAISLCVIVALSVVTVWSFPWGKRGANGQLYVFIALLGSTLLWTGVLTTVALDGFDPRAFVYILLQALMFGGFGLLVGSVLLNYIAIRRERES